MTEFPSLATLEAEEAQFILPSFSYADGLSIALAAAEKAKAESLPIAVDVFAYGQQIAHIAMPCSTADNGHWIRRKRNTVLRCAHSSLYMGQMGREKNVSIAEAYAMDPAEYAFHGGSIPVFIHEGGLIGAVTISGLQQVEDHRLAAALLTQLD